MAKAALEKILESEKEAQRIIDDAGKKAAAESEKIISEAEEKAAAELSAYKESSRRRIFEEKNKAEENIKNAEREIQEECAELKKRLECEADRLSDMLVSYIKDKR
ncbi:MAG: hypothetical protein J6N52_11405 [Clostridia bacterium]|nr:hypothetical protein [Clostridia bacterium]